MRALHRLYRWVLTWADHPAAVPFLFLLALTESCIVPIPPDPLLMALGFGKPRQAFRFATICTVGSVLGGLLGYWLGFAFQDFITAILRFVIDGLSHQGALLGTAAATAAVDPLTSAPVILGGSPVYQDGLLWMVTQLYRDNAFLAVLGAALTPIPYKVFTVAAGYCSISIPVFVAASVLGRGGRFFAIALLVFWCGPRIQPFVDRYFAWLTLAFFALLVGGFALVRLL